MASIRSIRKDRQKRMQLAPFYRRIYGIQRLMATAVDDFLKRFAKGLEAFTEMVKMYQPEHIFQVGEYATRDGSDVQQVIYATDRFADFKCILAPLTGWCEVEEVEHNAMRRYRHLTKDEAVAMVLARIHGAECKADGTMSAPIHGEGR